MNDNIELILFNVFTFYKFVHYLLIFIIVNDIFLIKKNTVSLIEKAEVEYVLLSIR